MYLEKIDIQGFKSFAQPTTLVFNKELTAIVGPNGSGKSNVADAIRWVLGEQSLKLLRGKKSDDVIFAGSDRKGRLGFAKVVLYLQNQERSAGIDYEQVVLERSIDRSGESTYLLNGSPARLTDIQLLLAKAHVGQKSYSVIGQGMIDTLLTFSAQERKDFFDEATGVRQYQMKKTQAIHKLDQTEENLHQAELVLQELEPRLRTLSRQVKRLERKEDLEKTLRELQSRYYGFLMGNLTKDLDATKTKLAKQQTLLDQLTTTEHDLQTKLEAFETGASRNENYNTLQQQLFQAQQEYNALTKKKIVLEGARDIERIKTGHGSDVVLRDRLDAVRRKLENLTAASQSLDHEITAAEKRLTALKETHEKSGAQLTALEKELATRSTERNWKDLESQAHSIHQEHATIHDHIERIASLEDIATFKERFHAFATKLTTFLERIRTTTTEDYQQHWSEYQRLKSEHDRASADLHAAQAECTMKRHEHASLIQQHRDLTHEERELAREVEQKTDTHATEDLQHIERDLKEKEKDIHTLRTHIDAFNTLEEQKKNDLLGLQKKLRTVQYDSSIQNNAVTTLKVELAKLETRAEELHREINEEAPTVTLATVSSLSPEETHEQIQTIKKQLNIIGGIDTETVKEYSDVHEKHAFLTQQTADLRAAEQSLIELITELDTHINTQFQHAFKNINALFTKYFKRLFNGGSAKLTLEIQTPKEEAETDEAVENSSDETNDTPADHGPKKIKNKRFDYTIDIQATPPGKKLASINMLSGGEKAMTAIALICSIIANNPPPFVVLDEVDAALDEANSIRFAEIISELLDKSQFITITHNRATMHQAKILYGVTMGDDGISRLLSVNFDQADKMSA